MFTIMLGKQIAGVLMGLKLAKRNWKDKRWSKT